MYEQTDLDLWIIFYIVYHCVFKNKLVDAAENGPLNVDILTCSAVCVSRTDTQR